MRLLNKKIAIATMIGQNQGNRLQNYALQNILEQITGARVETLRVAYGPRGFKRAAKKFLYRGFPSKRWARFEEFDNKYIHYSKHSIIDPNLANVGYSLFVIGSDQVWNPTFEYTSEAEFLPLIPTRQKISYAASFGVSKIEKCRTQIGSLLSGISKISVREQAGVDLVKELAEKDSTLVLDPTMLLSVDTWWLIAKRPRIEIPKTGYILKYVLGENITDDVALSFAPDSECSIIDLKDRSLPVGPAEFVWLISNAKFVCTDSFHASVFSILFHTPFAIFDRISDNEDMSSRFDTLCDLFSLEGCRVQRREKYKPSCINWAEVDSILVHARDKSLQFLEVCLHDAGIL